jgi:hypothetical protein
MLSAHFEQVRNLVSAEPARQPDEPLISLVLNTDPAIHAARSTGKTSAEGGNSSTRPRAFCCGAATAAASGPPVSGRDASRGRHSQAVEYKPSGLTADGEEVGVYAGAALVPSKSSVAELLLHTTSASTSIGSNTLENPC